MDSRTKSIMFSSKTDLWETPQWLYDRLDNEFHFNLDVCATPENAKCSAYYTPEMDGLSQPWYGCCWCNPPYGRELYKWVSKARNTANSGNIVVMLLPARTDTRWFHEYADWVWLVFPGEKPSENCWERGWKAYRLYSHERYGVSWIAYRRPPEGEEET